MGGWRLGGWRLGAATIGALSGRFLGKTWAAVGGQLLARRRRGRRWKTYINYQRLLKDVEFSKGELIIINFTLKKSNVFQKTLVIYIRLSTSSSTSSNVFQWARAPGRRRRRRGSRGRRKPGRRAGERVGSRAHGCARARGWWVGTGGSALPYGSVAVYELRAERPLEPPAFLKNAGTRCA